MNGDHNAGSTVVGKKSYIIVRETSSNWWVQVEGLNHHEVRVLSDKLNDGPEAQDRERSRVAEFSVPTWQILNSLERLGYRVITSGCMVTGYGKHDTKEFIWTLKKAKEDWELSSK